MRKTVTKVRNESLDNSLRIIGLVSKSLISAMDEGFMFEVVRRRTYLERLAGYEQAIRDACSKVLRVFDGNVYYHNGRYWESLGSNHFEFAVQKSLEHYKADMSDLVKGMFKVMCYASKGASLSVLSPRKSLVGFSNGVVDFDDIDNPVFHEFGDMMDVTSVLPYEWESTATCPTWTGFLCQVLQPWQVETLQEFMGLGVVPRNNLDRKVEKTLWLIGAGGNGKSVIHDVMEYVYGEDAFSNASLFNMIKPGDEGLRCVASIAGKIFNYCTEVSAGDISRNEGNFKSLVSGESQQVRLIGGNIQKIDEIPYLIFNMNQKPSDRNMGQALARRLLIIDFRSTVSDKDQRLDLVGELVKEASGIRNWLIEGYKKLRDKGYKFESPEANREYMIENEQTPLVFMTDKGYRSDPMAGHLDEAVQWVRASDLYDEYARWCQAKLGQDPDNSTKFGRDLVRNHYQRRTASGCRVYAIYSNKVIKYALKV